MCWKLSQDAVIKYFAVFCMFFNSCVETASLHADLVADQKLYGEMKKIELDLNFLINCRDNNLTLKFVRWKNLNSKRHHLRSSYHCRVLKETI